MQGAMRALLIYTVALSAVGCGKIDLSPSNGPAVAGTWKGSARGVTLNATLSASMCEFGCGGSVLAGSYSDSTAQAQVPFTNGAGPYSMSPPSGGLYSSPLPGWTISITPADTANASDTVVFNGTFSNTTSVTGYVKFTNGTVRDSVALSLTKQ